MRPASLDPLFTSVLTLPGVGTKIAALLARALDLPANVTEPRIVDLFWHLPTGVIDRRARPAIEAAVPGVITTLKVRVLKHVIPGRNSKAPYRVRCEDDTGGIDLIFFRADRRYLERTMPVGSERLVSGRIESYGETLQMPHPDHIVAPEAADTLPLLEPVYPLTAGLTIKTIAKAVSGALERLARHPEWLEPTLVERERWPAFHDALGTLHRPQDTTDVSNIGPPWQRLAYDELLANQLALAIVRDSLRAQKGRAISGDGHLRSKIIEALPFALTTSQTTALEEIYAQMAEPRRMLRLLQGDVGSGKTVVALLAMAAAIEAGSQAAIMAPTEVLARQHAETLAPLVFGTPITIALLTGREKGKTRENLLERLAAGEIDLLIGTHALFQSDVVFKDLALAVIDEQHRFGVHQRLALQSKGREYGADALVMTATPIPRTLLMTHYGDLDVSRLTEKPAGRKAVKTVALSAERIEEVIEGLARALDDGAQIYWVCPLVEDSTELELTSADQRHAHLNQHFKGRVGLVHGQMAATAKDKAMADFAASKTQILVSTTVIEVGVNVPNATIMVIEHAERFGLAQLHQLRGRVGRSDRQSFCTLLYHQPLTDTARQRLKTMCDTEDGFIIAEEDLRLRGGGEVLGTRQSGSPEFRVARIPNFEAHLAMARDDARLHLARDPRLESPRGEALKTLLYLFEQDEAVRLFRAG